jgi:hypothetical protein
MRRAKFSARRSSREARAPSRPVRRASTHRVDRLRGRGGSPIQPVSNPNSHNRELQGIFLFFGRCRESSPEYQRNFNWLQTNSPRKNDREFFETKQGIFLQRTRKDHERSPAAADHDDLAFELGKGQQDIEGQPPHAAGGIERLRHRHERHCVGVEQFDQLGEIGKRTSQAVDLVHHHDIDLAGAHLGEQRLQGRTVERRSGEAAIIVAVAQQSPALAGLAEDIGLARLPAGIERLKARSRLCSVDLRAYTAQRRIFDTAVFIAFAPAEVHHQTARCSRGGCRPEGSRRRPPNPRSAICALMGLLLGLDSTPPADLARLLEPGSLFGPNQRAFGRYDVVATDQVDYSFEDATGRRSTILASVLLSNIREHSEGALGHGNLGSQQPLTFREWKEIRNEVAHHRISRAPLSLAAVRARRTAEFQNSVFQRHVNSPGDTACPTQLGLAVSQPSLQASPGTGPRPMITSLNDTCSCSEPSFSGSLNMSC